MARKRHVDAKPLRRAKESSQSPHPSADRKTHRGLLAAGLAVTTALLGATAAVVANRYVPGVLTDVEKVAGKGSLVMSAHWNDPSRTQCDNNINLAGTSDSRDIAELENQSVNDLRVANADPRGALGEKLGAVNWYRGLLKIHLTASNQDVLFITAVDLIIYERKDIRPVWGYEQKPPCGGPSQFRLFEVKLDDGSIKDRGAIDNGVGYALPEVRDEPLGSTFSVAQHDPAELVFHVSTCDGYYEWGIKVTYLANGETFTKLVGSERDPLKSIGGWKDVRRYHADFNNAGLITSGPAVIPGAEGGSTPAGPGIPVSARQACS